MYLAIKRRRWLVGIILLGSLVAVLAGCNLTTTAPTAEPTPDLPQIRFIAPVNGATAFEGATIIADIAAEDTTVGIARIEFYVDGVMIQEGLPENGITSIYRVEMDWLAQGVGTHTFSATAYRPNEIPSTPATLLIEVVAPS